MLITSKIKSFIDNIFDLDSFLDIAILTIFADLTLINVDWISKLFIKYKYPQPEQCQTNREVRSG